MNINIICIGKIKDKYINEGIAEFSKRMTSFANLNIIELKEYNKEDNMNNFNRQRKPRYIKTAFKD